MAGGFEAKKRAGVFTVALSFMVVFLGRKRK